MKVFLKMFIFGFCLLSFLGLHSQERLQNNPGIPPQSNKSILFGYDTFINSQPLQNQRNIVICSAFNGWLYATYSYHDSNHQQDAFTILRSIDNGVSWSILFDGPLGLFNDEISKLSILACGHDTTNLKLFVGIGIFDTLTSGRSIWVIRFNNNGVVELEILHENSLEIKDFDLASDDLYPASNSSPFSLGLVYSKGTLTNDSIVFCSSSNGGISFDTRYNIASSSHYLDKVALAYGRSPSFNTGRYFAAWEDKSNATSTSGHIYTSHSEPNFNSPFTMPFLLDSLDVTTANKASNPVISCQNNASDNDSSNLSEVILYEKYIPSTHKFNIGGFYNKKATTSNNFNNFTIDASSNNKLQPDICFNAFDSTFIVTYFDSTAQKLPYYIHNLNMTEPDSWIQLSSGYNDYNNLLAPHPQVVMDFGEHMGANAWIGMLGNGSGAAMFDSPFTYYTGIPGNNENNDNFRVKVFPNPASEYAILEFELFQTEDIQVNLINSLGNTIANIPTFSCPPGKHQMRFDLQKYPAGVYVFAVHAGNSFSASKLAVIK
jgi:hypothetical protein